MKKTEKMLLAGIIGASLMLGASAFEIKNTYAEVQFTDVPSAEWYASDVKST